MPVNVSTKIVISFEDCLDNLSIQSAEVLKAGSISGGNSKRSSGNLQTDGQLATGTFKQSATISENFTGITGFVANGSANPQVVQGSILAEESSNLLLPSVGTESFATTLNSDSFKFNGLPIDQYIEQQLQFWLTGDPDINVAKAWDDLLLFTRFVAISIAEAFGESLSEFSRLAGEIGQSLSLTAFKLFDQIDKGMQGALKRVQDSIKKFFEASIKGIVSAKIITIEPPSGKGKDGFNPFPEFKTDAFFRSGTIGPSAGISSAPGIPSVALNLGFDNFQQVHINPLGQNNFNQQGTGNSFQDRDIVFFEVENIILNVPSDFRSRLTEREFAVQLRDEIFRLDRRMSK